MSFNNPRHFAPRGPGRGNNGGYRHPNAFIRHPFRGGRGGSPNNQRHPFGGFGSGGGGGPPTFRGRPGQRFPVNDFTPRGGPRSLFCPTNQQRGCAAGIRGPDKHFDRRVESSERSFRDVEGERRNDSRAPMGSSSSTRGSTSSAANRISSSANIRKQETYNRHTSMDRVSISDLQAHQQSPPASLGNTRRTSTELRERVVENLLGSKGVPSARSDNRRSIPSHAMLTSRENINIRDNRSPSALTDHHNSKSQRFDSASPSPSFDPSPINQPSRSASDQSWKSESNRSTDKRLNDYDRKLHKMKQYIPFLERMISRLQGNIEKIDEKMARNRTTISSLQKTQCYNERKSVNMQLEKISSLYKILTVSKMDSTGNPISNLSIETLNKCEDVLEKLYSKLHLNSTASNDSKCVESDRKDAHRSKAFELNSVANQGHLVGRGGTLSSKISPESPPSPDAYVTHQERLSASLDRKSQFSGSYQNKRREVARISSTPRSDICNTQAIISEDSLESPLSPPVASESKMKIDRASNRRFSTSEPRLKHSADQRRQLDTKGGSIRLLKNDLTEHRIERTDFVETPTSPDHNSNDHNLAIQTPSSPPQELEPKSPDSVRISSNASNADENIKRIHSGERINQTKIDSIGLKSVVEFEERDRNSNSVKIDKITNEDATSNKITTLKDILKQGYFQEREGTEDSGSKNSSRSTSECLEICDDVEIESRESRGIESANWDFGEKQGASEDTDETLTANRYTNFNVKIKSKKDQETNVDEELSNVSTEINSRLSMTSKDPRNRRSSVDKAAEKIGSEHSNLLPANQSIRDGETGILSNRSNRNRESIPTCIVPPLMSKTIPNPRGDVLRPPVGPRFETPQPFQRPAFSGGVGIGLATHPLRTPFRPRQEPTGVAFGSRPPHFRSPWNVRPSTPPPLTYGQFRKMRREQMEKEEQHARGTLEPSTTDTDSASSPSAVEVESSEEVTDSPIHSSVTDVTNVPTTSKSSVLGSFKIPKKKKVSVKESLEESLFTPTTIIRKTTKITTQTKKMIKKKTREPKEASDSSEAPAGNDSTPGTSESTTEQHEINEITTTKIEKINKKEYPVSHDKKATNKPMPASKKKALLLRKQEKERELKDAEGMGSTVPQNDEMKSSANTSYSMRKSTMRSRNDTNIFYDDECHHDLMVSSPEISDNEDEQDYFESKKQSVTELSIEDEADQSKDDSSASLFEAFDEPARVMLQSIVTSLNETDGKTLLKRARRQMNGPSGAFIGVPVSSSNKSLPSTDTASATENAESSTGKMSLTQLKSLLLLVQDSDSDSSSEDEDSTKTSSSVIMKKDEETLQPERLENVNMEPESKESSKPSEVDDTFAKVAEPEASKITVDEPNDNALNQISSCESLRIDESQGDVVITPKDVQIPNGVGNDSSDDDEDALMIADEELPEEESHSNDSTSSHALVVVETNIDENTNELIIDVDRSKDDLTFNDQSPSSFDEVNDAKKSETDAIDSSQTSVKSTHVVKVTTDDKSDEVAQIEELKVFEAEINIAHPSQQDICPSSLKLGSRPCILSKNAPKRKTWCPDQPKSTKRSLRSNSSAIDDEPVVKQEPVDAKLTDSDIFEVNKSVEIDETPFTLSDILKETDLTVNYAMMNSSELFGESEKNSLTHRVAYQNDSLSGLCQKLDDVCDKLRGNTHSSNNIVAEVRRIEDDSISLRESLTDNTENNIVEVPCFEGVDFNLRIEKLLSNVNEKLTENEIGNMDEQPQDTNLLSLMSEIHSKSAQMLQNEKEIDLETFKVENFVSKFCASKVMLRTSPIPLLSRRELSKLFKCPNMLRCKFTTDSAVTFSRHIVSGCMSTPCPESSLLTCIYCSAASEFEGQHQNNKVGITFQNIKTLITHIVEVHGHCSYQCSECPDFRFDTQVEMLLHSVKRHPCQKEENSLSPRFIKCRRVKSSRVLSTGDTVKKVKQWSMSCYLCRESTSYQPPDMVKHLMKCHVSMSSRSQQLFGQFICSKCPSFASNFLPETLAHIVQSEKCRHNLSTNIGQTIKSIFIDSRNLTSSANTKASEVIEARDTEYLSDDEVINFNDDIFDNSKYSVKTNPRATDGLYASSLYICSHCGPAASTFPTPSAFRNHISYSCPSNNVDSNTFSCFHCSSDFRLVSQLVDHMLRDHGLRRFLCSICPSTDVSFSVCSDIRRHMDVEHGIDCLRFWTVTSNDKLVTVSNINDGNLCDDKCYVAIPKMNTHPACSRPAAISCAVPGVASSFQSTGGAANSAKSNYNPKNSTLTKSCNTKKIIFSPSQIDSLPPTSVFQTVVFCSDCDYGTKMKCNMKRHLAAHLTNEQTSSQLCPVNPPTDLTSDASSIQKISLSRMTPLIADESEDAQFNTPLTREQLLRYPSYIEEESDRFACPIPHPECGYKSVDSTILLTHINTLHTHLEAFECPNCIKSSSSDNVVAFEDLDFHTKCHGSQLYACFFCNKYDWCKRTIEEHVSTSHPRKRLLVRDIRKNDSLLNTKTNDVVPSSPNSKVGSRKASMGLGIANAEKLTELALKGSSYQPYKCGLCLDAQESLDSIVKHLSEKHHLDSVGKYKCCFCPFYSDDKHEMGNHSCDKPLQRVKNSIKKRGGQNSSSSFYLTMYFIFPFSECQDIIFELDGEQADRSPLWRRDMPGLKHVRGIFYDEYYNESDGTLIKVDDGDRDIPNPTKSFLDIASQEFAESQQTEIFDSCKNNKRKRTSIESGKKKAKFSVKSDIIDQIQYNISTSLIPENGEVFKCKECGVFKKDVKGLKVHIKLAHLGLGKYKCLRCQFSANCLSSIETHYQITHPDECLSPVKGESTLSHSSINESCYEVRADISENVTDTVYSEEFWKNEWGIGASSSTVVANEPEVIENMTESEVPQINAIESDHVKTKTYNSKSKKGCKKRKSLPIHANNDSTKEEQSETLIPVELVPSSSCSPENPSMIPSKVQKRSHPSSLSHPPEMDVSPFEATPTYKCVFCAKRSQSLPSIQRHVSVKHCKEVKTSGSTNQNLNGFTVMKRDEVVDMLTMTKPSTVNTTSSGSDVELNGTSFKCFCCEEYTNTNILELKAHFLKAHRGVPVKVVKVSGGRALLNQSHTIYTGYLECQLCGHLTPGYDRSAQKVHYHEEHPLSNQLNVSKYILKNAHNANVSASIVASNLAPTVITNSSTKVTSNLFAELLQELDESNRSSFLLNCPYEVYSNHDSPDDSKLESCSFKSQHLNSMFGHFRRIHAPSFKCGHCGWRSKSSSEFHQHSALSHGDKIPDQIKDPESEAEMEALKALLDSSIVEQKNEILKAKQMELPATEENKTSNDKSAPLKKNIARKSTATKKRPSIVTFDESNDDIETQDEITAFGRKTRSCTRSNSMGSLSFNRPMKKKKQPTARKSTGSCAQRSTSWYGKPVEPVHWDQISTLMKMGGSLEIRLSASQVKTMVNLEPVLKIDDHYKM